MRYLKTYENKTYPQLGDFIKIESKDEFSWADRFGNNNIAQIVEIFDYDLHFYCLAKYDIKFDGVNKFGDKISTKYGITKGSFQFMEHDDGWRKVRLEDIEFFSKNKEDVEAYIASSKYNL